MFDNAGVPGGDPQGNRGTCLQYQKGFPDGLEVVDLMLGAVERVAKLATGSLGIQGTFGLKQKNTELGPAIQESARQRASHKAPELAERKRL